MDEDSTNDNWRQFQGTELGSLMSQLYAGNKPKINYPKPKARKSLDTQPQGNFIVAKVGATDPRKATKTDADIAIPAFGRKSSHAEPRFHAVDAIPRRRNEAAIKSEMDDIKMRQAYYRPAHTQAVSSESEKQRLSEI